MKTSWEVLNFDDVFEDVTKYFTKIPANDYKSDGYHAIIDQSQQFIAGYTDIDLPKNEMESPLIIFGDHTRIFKFIDFECFIGADGVKVLRNKIIGDTKYYYHFLTNLEIENNGYSRHFKFLKRHKIIVPPISEQKRIAAILDKADEIRRKREQAIAKLEQLAQSIFVEMFGDPVTNSKNLPIKKLGDVAKFINGGTPKKDIKCYWSGDIAWISSADIIDDKIQLTRNYISTLAINDSATNLVPANTLLIVTRTGVGKITITPIPLCFSQDITAILLNENCDIKYIAQSIRGQNQAIVAQARGATIKGITRDVLVNLKILLPPLALQEEFAKRINQIEKLKADNTTALANHNALFASLQQQAFSGNL